jgi:predicted dehydrogenase
MDARMIRVAVIGCGYWGPNLIRNFSSIESCELRVICDTDPAQLAPLERQYPGCRTETDPQAVFAASDVDAVAICTPVRTHYALAAAALDAGKHVLVEKPLSDSVDHAQKLVELAEQKGLVLQVDHTFVYNSAIRAVRKMVDDGYLGDLLYVDSVRVNLGLFRSDVSVLWDLAVHDVSIISHLIDAEPEWVTCVGTSPYGEFENLAYLTIMYPDSLIAHAHVNWLSPVKLRSTLIGGSSRMVHYDDLAPSEKIKVYDRGVTVNGLLRDDDGTRKRALVDYRLGGMEAPYIEKVEPLEEVCLDFVRCCESGATPVVDGREGLSVVRILSAAAESIRKKGDRVSLAPS